MPDRKDATEDQVRTLLAQNKDNGIEEIYTPTRREVQETFAEAAVTRRRNALSATEKRDRNAERERLKRQVTLQLYKDLGHLPSQRQIKRALSHLR